MGNLKPVIILFVLFTVLSLGCTTTDSNTQDPASTQDEIDCTYPPITLNEIFDHPGAVGQFQINFTSPDYGNGWIGATDARDWCYRGGRTGQNVNYLYCMQTWGIHRDRVSSDGTILPTESISRPLVIDITNATTKDSVDGWGRQIKIHTGFRFMDPVCANAPPQQAGITS